MTDRKLPPTARTRIRRTSERACCDVEMLHKIIDAAWFCHVAFADEGGVHCIPMACWRDGGWLYVHGSNGSRTLRALAEGAELCVAISHLDGLVLARSAFNHSMNYRSAVIYGRCERVPEEDKAAALTSLMRHIAPGRESEARAADRNELAATLVVRLALAEAAAKVRTGGPEDDAADLPLPVWAGVLPLRLQRLPAERDPSCSVDPPGYVSEWSG